MNKEQEAKFEKWYNSSASWGSAGDGLRRAWLACLEANGIGEEPRTVEATVIDVNGYFKIDWNSRPWATEVRVGYASKDMRPDAIGDRIVTIPRPVPAWKPKDGEAVLFEFSGYAQSGVYKQGSVYAGNQSFHYAMPMKPFDETNRGKPWSEI